MNRTEPSADLPTFAVGGNELYRRIALVAIDGRIEQACHPGFSPEQNAQAVRDWRERR